MMSVWALANNFRGKQMQVVELTGEEIMDIREDKITATKNAIVALGTLKSLFEQRIAIMYAYGDTSAIDDEIERLVERL